MRLMPIVLVLCLAVEATAQVPSDTVLVLEEIQVEAARSYVVEHQAPFSLFVFDRSEEISSLDGALSLQDLGAHIPGLWIADRGHLALGERIALRGASARSPFGTRGIQILYDGIPLTMPDGQAVTDIIDPRMVQRIEVIRGPAATFWGNAAAGTIAFSSESWKEEVAVTAQAASHGTYYGGVRGAAAGEEWRAGGYLSHLSFGGFRDHSDGVFHRGGFRAEREVGPTTLLKVVGAGAWQDVKSPGSLTLAEWDDDASAANPAYVRTASGKESAQAQAGIFLAHGFENALVEAGTYGIIRELRNPLPFAIIDVSRSVAGARLNFTQRLARLEWSLGADAAIQSDGRLNFPNLDGGQGEVPTLDQREQVVAGGMNAYARFRLADALHASLGLRADVLRYSLDDRMPDEDLSGARSFHALSPAVGVTARAGDVIFYGSLASSFETPTTTELVNRPGTAAGFNPDLRPERTWSIEAGARGHMTPGLRGDISMFWMRVEDRLLPYQTQEGGDRTFFRNAEAGHHLGAEAFLHLSPTAAVDVIASYSLLDATFVAFGDETRQIPGVPRHSLSAEVAYTPAWWRVWTQAAASSGFFADDANAAEVDGFITVDAGIAYANLRLGSLLARPYLRVDNVFDATYSRSVVVNASFGRYYEPSPGRTFSLGITVGT